jgi:ketosteroid isomerase-like protein
MELERRRIVAAQDDIDLVRKGFEAFVAGDMVWMNEHLHENIVWHVPGHNVLSGDHRGREYVLAFLARSVQIAIPEIDIHDVVGSEDHVVAIQTVRWRRNDNAETFQDHGVMVFHVAEGQAIEVWTLLEHQREFDEFLEGTPPRQA